MLDALAKASAPATFFVLAPRAALYPSLVSSILARGHDVAFHCAEHVRHDAMTSKEIEADLESGLAALGRPVGYWRGPCPRRGERLYRMRRGGIPLTILAEPSPGGETQHWQFSDRWPRTAHLPGRREPRTGPARIPHPDRAPPFGQGHHLDPFGRPRQPRPLLRPSQDGPKPWRARHRSPGRHYSIVSWIQSPTLSGSAILAVLATMDAGRSSGEHREEGGSARCHYSWTTTGTWRV
jgi:hypothetical protein